MSSFNKVLLMGNLTRDPQLSYMPSQTAVVDFGLATNRKWTGKDGSQKDETCFVDCRAFGKLAENINKYLKKGMPLFVEGRLTFDTWTGKDGSKHSKHRVTVESFKFIGSASGSAASSAGQAEAPAAEENEPQSQKGDDDIPF
jgi:single-strand DNA-binding protein